MTEVGYLGPVIAHIQNPQMEWSWNWQAPKSDSGWEGQVHIQGNPDKNGQNDVTGIMPPPPPPSGYLLQLSHQNPVAYLPFVAFILSEVILGLVGFYLSAADKNSNWFVNKWNWTGDATYAVAVAGGVEGVFMPYSFYYSMESIGIEATMFTALGGAYLGGAAANGGWKASRWNWNTPKTINGIFEGVQNTVWLVDAIASIYSFIKDSHLGPAEETVFEKVTYLTGAVISYYYIAEDKNGNYFFWEWDLTNPGILYGIIRGFESGTRIPVGFGEILVGFLEAVEKSLDKPDFYDSLMRNFVVKNRLKIAGALWLAIVYTSEENETLDIDKWNVSQFSTLEAFVNGIVFGKDLDEMFLDVRKYLLGGGNDNNDNNDRDRGGGGALADYNNNNNNNSANKMR